MKRVALVFVLACGGQQQTEPQPVTIPTATATATAAPTDTAMTAAAVPAPSDTPPPPPSNASVLVDRDVWVSQFEMALPVALCRDNFYFRSCFTVSAEECERTAASATRVCLLKFKKQLPEKFHQPDDGTAWGSKIGDCVGTAYEVALPSHRISNAKCNDPSQWTTPP